MFLTPSCLTRSSFTAVFTIITQCRNRCYHFLWNDEHRDTEADCCSEKQSLFYFSFLKSKKVFACVCVCVCACVTLHTCTLWQTEQKSINRWGAVHWFRCSHCALLLFHMLNHIFHNTFDIFYAPSSASLSGAS